MATTIVKLAPKVRFSPTSNFVRLKVFHRTKLLVLVESVYCASFTIEVAIPRFRNVATSQSGLTVDLLNFFFDEVGGDIG
ncbi:predicted protein [Lichtheimia corymbifera JMRC:FSU:9682]|uniref:Uncharacterized protein n=1 Tax=Lichtheimia corymbifera JMRC:FSU:9682 TaxID=1263082 RepID=A0A068S482_9FUNG|nr:predicted protein [Lichtheimia corymbifera JMRC:FSU:9682]